MRYFIIFLTFMSTMVRAEPMLYPIEGEPLDFSFLKGKWVFINYWASWCGPCLQEISELNKFYKANQNNIALYAVNYDMLPLQEQKDLMSELKINYPALMNDPAPSLNLGDIRGVPATFVFNPKGQFVTTLYGAQKAASLQKLVSDHA